MNYTLALLFIIGRSQASQHKQDRIPEAGDVDEDVRIIAAAQNSKSQTGFHGRYLIWQQPKNRVQEEPLTHDGKR